ncbi:MAG: hypothetical protein PXY39_13980 [archaeon]|nr:hypothetical protein [archaeon]
MVFSQNYLQFPNDPVALMEWFAASVILVLLVTLVYVYILSRSPPPEGNTVSKLEQSIETTQVTPDPSVLLLRADTALKNNGFGEAVESSAEAVGLCLTQLVRRASGQVSPGMGVSDLAYLVQTKAKSAPQIAETVYQLNSLRLKVAQNQPVDLQQASWAVSFANWLYQVVQTEQIKF